MRRLQQLCRIDWDIVADIKPDLLLSECAERFITALPTVEWVRTVRYTPTVVIARLDPVMQ